MKRHLLVLFALAAVAVCLPMNSASAQNLGGHGHNVGHRGNFGHGPNSRGVRINRGFSALGIGGDFGWGWDIADLYRQLYQNLPYFALHPPVYYSYPVPRTYGYSPFAYGPEIMTPDVVEESKPVTIDNPYVPLKKAGPVEAKSSDRSASITSTPEPLVITNPYVTPAASVAKTGT
jgi:hypothetical protein